MMSVLGQTLDRIIEGIAQLKEVRKEDLKFGDLVLIKTKNSLYSVYVLEAGDYLVCGGWFDRKGLSPKKVSIAGCTWGGSILKADTIAACGLHLEFSNRVITTPIQKVYVLSASGKS